MTKLDTIIKLLNKKGYKKDISKFLSWLTERYDQRFIQCEYCGKFYIEEDSNADEDIELYCSSECFWGAEKEYKERKRDIFYHDYWRNK